MDIFVTDIDALRLLRLARIDGSLALAATDVHQVTPHAAVGLDADDLAALESLGLGPLSPATPLHVRVAGRQWRSHNPSVRPHLSSSPLPAGSFCRLIPTKGNTPAARALVRLNVYLDSPATCLASLAHRCMPLVARGRLTRERLLLRLSSICMELTGSYSSGADEGTCTFGLKPTCDYEGMLTILDDAHYLRGGSLAMTATSRAMPDSASPMETLLGLAVALPPRGGGFSIERPLLNQPLELTARQRSLMRHTTMRPDVYLPRHRIALEYLGRDYHEGERAMLEDSARIQDYQTCGITVFTVTFADVRSVTTLDSLMLRLAHEMARSGDKNVRDHIHRIVADEKARQARMTLLAELLPRHTE